ncbi:MAG: hypothetical protein J6M92_06470 [Oribacterium sp.]|nr:hypothetical protein [Oribacterium sp.]
MTNEQIIFNDRIRLMNEGVIGTTGKNIVIEDGEGRKTLVREPEQIHTYMEWKRRGYTVRHGEKCISRLQIWKSVPQKNKEGEAPQEKMIMKEAFFFKASQVERSVEEVKAV